MTTSDALNEAGSEENKSGGKIRFTSRQLAILAVLCFAQFCLAASVSLQGPFFPREAEKKGASATIYGLIFGSFELAAIISSPLYGKLVVVATPKFLIVSGLFVAGSCSVLFGFLDRAPPGIPFIGLSFACRITEGLAAAAITLASYTCLAGEFPEKVATTFSMAETFFGIGLIVGPTIGGLLYEAQGFGLPFQLMGSMLLLSAICSFFLLPQTQGQKKTGNMLKFLSDPGVLLDSFSIITALVYVGFFGATLEPYLRQFDLSPSLVGVIYVISGCIYGITTPIWGILCDKGITPKLIGIIGYILQSVSIVILGPAPFIPLEPRLWLIIVSLVIGGLGISAKIVSAFIGCLQDTLNRGFPNDITTQGMVSALFSTSIPIGAFVGPSLGGWLWDKVGFRKATMVYLGIDLIFLVLLLTFIVWRTKRNKKEEMSSETTPLYSPRRCSSGTSSSSA